MLSSADTLQFSIDTCQLSKHNFINLKNPTNQNLNNSFIAISHSQLQSSAAVVILPVNHTWCSFLKFSNACLKLTMRTITHQYKLDAVTCLAVLGACGPMQRRLTVGQPSVWIGTSIQQDLDGFQIATRHGAHERR
jgi:hypothetical protein